MAGERVAPADPDRRPPRRRRTPEQAREEIVAAARGLLDEHGPDALTVAEVMKRTTLSRKSFYVHFDGRAELLLALLLPLRKEADAALRTWLGAGDARSAGREALAQAALTYREHGAVLRAVFWSSGQDPDVVEVRRQLTAPIHAAARRIVRHLAAGLRDPDTVSAALATMNVHVLLDLAPEANDEQLDALVDALATVWERTLGLDDAPTDDDDGSSNDVG